MHFNYKGFLFVLLTLVWGGITTSCHSELEDSLSDNEHRGEAEPTFREGDSITITGQLDLPEMQVPTRAEVSNIQNLTLLVFDENHRFLYSAPANLTRQERNIAGGENQLPAQGSAQDNKAPNSYRALVSASSTSLPITTSLPTGHRTINSKTPTRGNSSIASPTPTSAALSTGAPSASPSSTPAASTIASFACSAIKP